jgi:stage V sporulation protein AF
MATRADQAVRIEPVLQRNVDYVNRTIGIGTSWDIIQKPFEFGDIRMMTYVMNGFFMTIHVLVLLQSFEQTIQNFLREHDDHTPISVGDVRPHGSSHSLYPLRSHGDVHRRL